MGESYRSAVYTPASVSPSHHLAHTPESHSAVSFHSVVTEPVHQGNTTSYVVAVALAVVVAHVVDVHARYDVARTTVE